MTRHDLAGTGGAIQPDANAHRGAKLGVATGVLGVLSAVLSVVAAYLGVQNSRISAKNDTLNGSVSSLHSTASALQSANQGLQSSNSAAQATISSLRSQLAAPTASILPDSPPVVRNDSGKNGITIAADNDLDLDGKGPTWPPLSGSSSDIEYYSDGSLGFLSGAKYRILTSQATYDSCQTTGYSGGAITADAISNGTQICVHTDQHRYVALKVLQVNTSDIVLDATSYDPPSS